MTIIKWGMRALVVGVVGFGLNELRKADAENTCSACREVLRPIEADGNLPPGQHAIAGMPYFKVEARRLPTVRKDHDVKVVVHDVMGEVETTRSVSLDTIKALNHVERESDLHCLYGWTRQHMKWSGVPFKIFYDTVIAPGIKRDPKDPLDYPPNYLVVEGLDGMRSTLMLEDVLVDGVLLADGLDGKPLTRMRGAPLRLVSPAQYAVKGVKHVSLIEVHRGEPAEETPEHPRSRVAEEERHVSLPGIAVRWWRWSQAVYRCHNEHLLTDYQRRHEAEIAAERASSRW